jgi:hypothetical protein
MSQVKISKNIEIYIYLIGSYSLHTQAGFNTMRYKGREFCVGEW